MMTYFFSRDVSIRHKEHKGMDMDDITTTVVVCSLLLAAVIKRRHQLKKKRLQRRPCVWTKSWILKRSTQGAVNQLLVELRLCDTSSYRNFVRMDASSFEELLCAVAPLITHKKTVMRTAISPAERLSIMLRFLVTGQSVMHNITSY